ncbi:hypothetical protein MSIMFB_03887 [Mycobacterium simulans]|uniref:SIR2-like domain-containing protein n=1 Tax=Mycobacterium simulans TaxID=627089 RepID=A0A7Z7NB04_9MYCO|nr:SIR2 family protein [Mycobacterium simulans]SOJ56410.1 hypothetical protein MSIMFB_03887 [Mycobacterium simulans]
MTGAPPGLRLLTDLDGERRLDREGMHTLIPCIHEQLELDLELLSAGARRSGGTLYDLSAEASVWENPPGPLVADRHDVVQGMCRAAVGDALPAEVVITDTGNGIEARVNDGSNKPPEPSLVLILRAAALIASSAYDQSAFVLVAANIASTDPRRRELLWKMLTIPPMDLNLANRSVTLVPIIGTRPDPETDYRRQPPPRYVVTWDRVLKRSPVNHRRAVETVGAASDQPLVLFLGAGASATSGILLGNAYRDIALKGLVGDRTDKADAFFDYLHERDRFMPGETDQRAKFVAELTLERVLRETFAELGFQPRANSPVIKVLTDDCQKALSFVRPGRKALREIAALKRRRVIIMTVNFDRLVEDELGTDCRVLYTPQHYEEHLDELRRYAVGDIDSPLPILKLHGSIEDAQSLIATIDTTSAGLQKNVRNALNSILEVSESPLQWVWVGCSMRDQDMNAWLGGLSADALDEWWVDPLPGIALDEFFSARRAPTWSQRGLTLQDRLIIDSADGFLRDLAEHFKTQ